MMASTISNIPTKTSVERKTRGDGYLFAIDIGTLNAWTFDLTDSEFEEFLRQVTRAHGPVRESRMTTPEPSNKPAQTNVPQPPPTGNGQVVLWQAIARAVESMDLDEADWLCELLHKRAVEGKAKYGTWLRAKNGRDVARDYLEEVLDAFMYATQEWLQTSSDSARAKQEAALAAIQLCYEDGHKKLPPTQAFDKMREKFGGKFNDFDGSEE